MVGWRNGIGKVGFQSLVEQSEPSLISLSRANKLDSTVPWILAAVSFPVMAGKQFINVIQLVKASRWLAEGDLAERRKLGLPRTKKRN